MQSTTATVTTPTPDPLIIGLCGHAGAGKDTAADYLCAHHGFERYAFALPIQTMIEALLVEAGCDHAYIFERSLKEQPIPGLGLSYRHLAQTLGTEWGRSVLAPDFWLRAAALALGLPGAPVHDRIVITDVRFPNEAAWIEQHGGKVIRLFRPGAAPVRCHPSEHYINQIGHWARIDNAGSLDELCADLDTAVAALTTTPTTTREALTS